MNERLLIRVAAMRRAGEIGRDHAGESMPEYYNWSVYR
jgi:hypothetical protein